MSPKTILLTLKSSRIASKEKTVAELTDVGRVISNGMNVVAGRSNREYFNTHILKGIRFISEEIDTATRGQWANNFIFELSDQAKLEKFEAGLRYRLRITNPDFFLTIEPIEYSDEVHRHYVLFYNDKSQQRKNQRIGNSEIISRVFSFGDWL